MAEEAVWKYSLTPGSSLVEMPRGARALDVQVQDGWPVMWALVDPTQPYDKYRVDVIPTGVWYDLPNIMTYVGTFQLNGDVGHVFFAGGKA